MEKPLQLGEFLRHNNAYFSHIREMVAYYNIYHEREEYGFYQVPIPIKEMGVEPFEDVITAMRLLRWVSEAIKNNKLVKITPD